MKAKKLLALGLLSAMAVTTMSGTSVFATENEMAGTGATNVEYTPGRSTGGDGDGNVSSWTVDYPVKIVLDDATKDADSGVAINFALLKTGETQTPYDGSAEVTATLAAHDHATSDGTSIKMQDTSNSNTLKDDVTMQLAKEDDSVVKTNDESTPFTTLKRDAAKYALSAYLSDNSGAENKKTYKTTLTWNFHSDAY